MAENIITVQSLTKTFPKRGGSKRVEVFKDIEMSVAHGEFLLILGPSGCGKSTFLRILAGLEKQTSGNVTYASSYRTDRVGFVFQNFGLLPWLTVFQNIELNLIGEGVPLAERIRRVREALVQFGLEQASEQFPHALSVGMRQRVGLARAFVIKPSIIFLDEPFSELDFFSAGTLRKLLLDLWQKEKMTVVMVSHYIEEAVLLADRVAVFGDKPGTLHTIVTNKLSRPRNERSAVFFKKEDEILGHFST